MTTHRERLLGQARADLTALPDKRVIACNVVEGTSTARPGALAYVAWTNVGGGNDRINLLIRSRGGRWIEKWENMRRLGNFRHKTLPPEHPLYDRLSDYSDEMLEWVRDCCARINGGAIES